MKKFYYLMFTFICIFCSCLVFAKDEITIEKMIPVYDENSGVIVAEENGIHSVIFNDEDQNVKYNIVLKNNTKRDISLSDIVLPESPEEFFKYEFVGIDENTVLKSNSTEEVVLSLETVKTEGWGRNFTLDLTNKIEMENVSVINPNTAVKDILLLLTCVTFITGFLIISVKSKRVSRYVVFILMFGSIISVTKAKDSIILPIKLNVSFESQNVMKMAYTYDENNKIIFQDYWNYAPNIKTFNIANELSEITEYAYKFDVTEAQDGKVIAYLVENEEDNAYYDLYLQANGIIYPNANADRYFFRMVVLESINNLAGLDTSNVTNMSNMFAWCSRSVTKDFILDLSSFDTSSVTNMSYMFSQTGDNSPTFTLDVSNFNTSKVTNMSHMFESAGDSNPNFTLDVSNFDTSNVTDMSGMFSGVGYSNTNFILDVSNFDTSNVTNMSGMFSRVGYNNRNFILDVSNFDTSNVTDMSYMFSGIAHNDPTFVLDVSNFDTSNVTDMSNMFSSVGYNNPKFTLNLSNFDTSNVTNMSYMFSGSGSNSTEYILDLSNFDTSNVTDMSNMFLNATYNASSFILDLSSFDTTNVTNMNGMFSSVGRNTNVMSTLDTSHFVYNDLVDVSTMFFCTGYDSTALNVLVSITNPNISTYDRIFNAAVEKTGGKITVNYTSATSSLVDKMIATRSAGSNVVKGKLIVDVDNLSVGDEVRISGEKFNVVSQNDDTITLLTKYNLGTDYRQSTSENYVLFANNTGWECSTGKNEIDISAWSLVVNTYINEYVDYISDELSDDSVTGDLMTLKQLSSLGCVIPTNYEYVADSNGRTCSDSNHIGWINNNQRWWTKSAVFEYSDYVWIVGVDNHLGVGLYNYSRGIRPVITISKESLKEYVGV